MIKIDSVICEYVAERDGISWLIFDVLLECCRDNPFEALLRKEALNAMQEIAYEQGGYSIEIVPMYCQPYDRTFLMKEIRNEKGEPVTEEVVGWYYGRPNNDDTQMFIGDLKAIHEEIEYETD